MTITPLDVASYLRRLDVPAPERPDAAALRALHAAHVERVAYETLDIQLGRMTTIDPHDSAARVLRGRGGYCYHLNGAFSLLLTALGYDVVWHRAGVQNRAEPEPPGAEWANHLALTVHGLPTDDCPSGSWLVDVGLGDALHEPLPLQAGTYEQGPYRFELRPSEVEAGGWRFEHDPRGSFAGMDFRPARATVDDFAERHVYLSTSPASGFVRTLAVQRRDATGVDVLRGCVLSREGFGPVAPRDIDSPAEWFGVLADLFALDLSDIDGQARDALWARVRTAHEAWLRATAEAQPSPAPPSP